jgi:hypothetical protein
MDGWIDLGGEYLGVCLAETLVFALLCFALEGRSKNEVLARRLRRSQD